MEVEEELDDQWMKEFECIDREYADLYNNDIFFTNIHFIYINKENDIENIIEQKFIMSRPNYIERDEIIGLIKRNFIKNDIRYILLSILKYNFHLSSNNIYSYLRYENNNNELNYLTIIKNIDTIKFEKTISMFQDLNDLYFIFYEKNDSSDEKSVISRLQSDFYSNHIKSNTVTKRIFLKSIKKHRKTQRK